MKNIYYELMKNYGINETKMETALVTLLQNDTNFRKKMLSSAFRTKFNYKDSVVETEVSRAGKGRTDIEITDPSGAKFVWELKVGWAFPTRKQIDMYKSIKGVKEVATLTNVEDKNDTNEERNTTWLDVANTVPDIESLKPFKEFFRDFGPVNTKARKKLSKTISGNYNNYDSYVFPISNKKGNFQNGYDGVSILEEFNKYIIPSPNNNKLGKNYLTLNENIKYLAFRTPIDKDKKTRLFVMKINSIQNLMPEEINKILSKDIVWSKGQEQYSGEHYLIDLELMDVREIEYGYSNGQVSFYAPFKELINKKHKSLFKIREATK